MEYTVWRHGVLLGRTALEMPSPGPDTRAGQLEPTLELEQAWAEFGPTVQEFFAAAGALAETMGEMPAAAADVSPVERGREIFEWLTAQPDAARLRARVKAATDALADVGLELHDAAGRHVPTESVMIQQILPPAWIPPEAIERTLAEAREEGLDIRVPMYIAIVRGTANP